jgi:adenosine kinase
MVNGRIVLMGVVCRDAFAGGFCAGVVLNKSLEECMDMGQWLASLSIQELGPS